MICPSFPLIHKHVLFSFLPRPVRQGLSEGLGGQPAATGNWPARSSTFSSLQEIHYPELFRGLCVRSVAIVLCSRKFIYRRVSTLSNSRERAESSLPGTRVSVSACGKRRGLPKGSSGKEKGRESSGSLAGTLPQIMLRRLGHMFRLQRLQRWRCVCSEGVPNSLIQCTRAQLNTAREKPQWENLGPDNINQFGKGGNHCQLKINHFFKPTVFYSQPQLDKNTLKKP